jgi:hypothetical protein
MVDEIVDVEGHRVPRRILDMYPLLPYALRALMADHNGEEPSVRCPVCDIARLFWTSTCVAKLRWNSHKHRNTQDIPSPLTS